MAALISIKLRVAIYNIPENTHIFIFNLCISLLQDINEEEGRIR